ncbi:CmaA [Symbiodinium sp. CCMP2592]|nr:CmaA [Symbiodinium sp. CCMP2592]
MAMSQESVRDSVFLQHSATTFDASLLETFAPLSNGASVDFFMQTPDKIPDYLRLRRVSHAFFTTKLFELLVEHFNCNLTRIFYGGEAMMIARALEFHRLYASKGITLIHAYGPTENGVFSTTLNLTEKLARGSSGDYLNNNIGTV